MRISHLYLTLWIQDTSKQVPLQTVKTQMKCHIILPFIESIVFVKIKKIFKQKIQYCLENYNLTPLDICIMDYPKLIVLNQMEEFITIQRVNILGCFTLNWIHGLSVFILLEFKH